MKLAIIHFQPLEYYPPVTNFLNYLGNAADFDMLVISTHNVKGREVYSNKKLRFSRTSLPVPGEKGLVRLCKYWLFNIVAVFKLFLFKPDTILYYESYSSFPVYVYKRFLGFRTKIYIHYHEYFSREWYDRGMKLIKWYNHFEKKYLWKKASWISQTNEDRLRLFLVENSMVSKNIVGVLPNYPPSDWVSQAKIRERSGTTKFVFIGSLSFESTYIKEFCEWVKQHPNLLTLDIFAFNLHQDALSYLLETDATNIRFDSRGVEYSDIPVKLENYDVGLILYKANTLNHIYNATNKLFEYLACGLDVWFPKEMLGCYPYISEGTFPKVMPIDFKSLNEIDFKMLSSHKGLDYKPSVYFCEPVYERFCEKLIQSE